MAEEKPQGIIAVLSAEIKRRKEAGQFLIERQDLESVIDLSGISEEEKDRAAKRYWICNALYINHYRSSGSNDGIFLDIDGIKSRYIFEHMTNKTEQEVTAKKEILKFLLSIEQGLPQEDMTGMAFTFDDNGNAIFYEEMSRDEKIEFIRKLQEKAEQAM